MLPRRHTLDGAWLCTLGLIVCHSVCAQDRIPRPGAPGALPAAKHDVTRRADDLERDNRQALPSPFAAGIAPTAFMEIRNLTRPNERDSTGSGNMADDTGGDQQQDPAARVRELEEQLQRLSASENATSIESVSARVRVLEDTVGGIENDESQFLETLAQTSRRVINGRIHLDSWQFPHSSPGINAIETGDFSMRPEDRARHRVTARKMRGRESMDSGYGRWMVEPPRPRAGTGTGEPKADNTDNFCLRADDDRCC